MRRKLTRVVIAGALVAGVQLASVVPVAAAGGKVDRIENVPTIVIVRMDADFPLHSIMQADCAFTQFTQLPDGSGVETESCQLNNNPVPFPEFQGEPPTTGFVMSVGPCEWESDYWTMKTGAIVFASSLQISITPSGQVHATSFYPAVPLICE